MGEHAARVPTTGSQLCSPAVSSAADLAASSAAVRVRSASRFRSSGRTGSSDFFFFKTPQLFTTSSGLGQLTLIYFRFVTTKSFSVELEKNLSLILSLAFSRFKKADRPAGVLGRQEHIAECRIRSDSIGLSTDPPKK